MLVQLPNGRTVNMSIEQYLALDDADIQYMISTGCGGIASSPWCGSAVKRPGRVRVKDEDDDPEETRGLSEDELDLDDDVPDPLANDLDGELDVPEPEE